MTNNQLPDDRPAEAIVAQMLDGFKVTQALGAAAELSIFDLLGDGPLTAAELAAKAGAHAPSLLRLLRYLTSIGVLLEDDQLRFSATALGEVLRADHPKTVRPWARMFRSQNFWRSWGELLETVTTGEPAFNRIYGEGHFDYLSQHPDDAAIFNAAMTRGTARGLPGILDGYDYTRFKKVVDVAGGHGALLRGILERAPDAAGVLYEMPAVAAEARQLRGSPVESRCEFIGGDMFQSIPSGGDLYIMKWIMHDWNDPAATQILKNVRQAMPPGDANARLVVVDRIVKPSNQPDSAKLSDLMMLVMLNGRERTEAEFRELFAAAGFRLNRAIPAGEFSLIEGIPV